MGRKSLVLAFVKHSFKVSQSLCLIYFYRNYCIALNKKWCDSQPRQVHQLGFEENGLSWCQTSMWIDESWLDCSNCDFFFTVISSWALSSTLEKPSWSLILVNSGHESWTKLSWSKFCRSSLIATFTFVLLRAWELSKTLLQTCSLNSYDNSNPY